MKFLISSCFAFLLVSCSNIPAPSFISPELSRNVSLKGYGSNPSAYTNILKKYLMKELKNHKETKIEFVNEPQRLSVNHLGDTYSGYRVCLSINEKKDGYYKGWRNHFFMINDDKVTLHLYDSGLLTIPFEYCITRNATKSMLVQNIPETFKNEKLENEKLENEKIYNAQSIDDMDKRKLSLAHSDSKYKSDSFGNKFIHCVLNNKEMTFVFNESDNTFYQFEVNDKKFFEPKFTEVLIAARSPNVNIDINRVSGSIEIASKSSKSNGKCDILDKTRF